MQIYLIKDTFELDNNGWICVPVVHLEQYTKELGV